MRIIAKTAQRSNPLAVGELYQDPSGSVGEGCFPRHIRNGYFKSAMNTWSNPMTASSTMIMDGWFAKKNGAIVTNFARGVPLGTGGWKSRFNAVATLQSNASPLSTDYMIMEQRTYGCEVYADRIITTDFMGSATVDGTVIGVEVMLDEANGTTTTVTAGTFTLGTVPKEFRAQVALPPLSGAALGSLHNIKLRFWLYGGSSFTSRFGCAINNTTGISVTLGSIRDGSMSYEPSTADEVLAVAAYYHTSARVQFMAAAATSSFSVTAVSFTPFPTPAAYTPAPGNVAVTTTFLNGPAVTVDQYGFSLSGAPNNATSAARITNYTLNIELPE